MAEVVITEPHPEISMDTINPIERPQEDISNLDIDAAINEVFIEETNLNLSLLGNVLKYFLHQMTTTKQNEAKERQILNVKVNDLFHSANFLRGRDFRLADALGHPEDVGQVLDSRLSKLENAIAELQQSPSSNPPRPSSPSSPSPSPSPSSKQPTSTPLSNKSSSKQNIPSSRPQQRDEEQKVNSNNPAPVSEQTTPLADPTAISAANVPEEPERVASPVESLVGSEAAVGADLGGISDSMQALETRMRQVQVETSSVMGLMLSMQDKVHLVADTAETALNRSNHVLTIESHPVVRALDVKLFDLSRAQIELNQKLETAEALLKQNCEENAVLAVKVDELQQAMEAQAEQLRIKQTTNPSNHLSIQHSDLVSALSQPHTRPGTVKSGGGAQETFPTPGGDNDEAKAGQAPDVVSTGTSLELSGVRGKELNQHVGAAAVFLTSVDKKDPPAVTSRASSPDLTLAEDEDPDEDEKWAETQRQEEVKRQVEEELLQRKKDLDYLQEERLAKLERKMELFSDADLSMQSQITTLEKRVSLDMNIIRRQLALKVNIAALTLPEHELSGGSPPRISGGPSTAQTQHKPTNTKSAGAGSVRNPHPPLTLRSKAGVDSPKKMNNLTVVNTLENDSIRGNTTQVGVREQNQIYHANSGVSGPQAMSTLSMLLGTKADVEMFRGLEEHVHTYFEEQAYLITCNHKAIKKLGLTPENEQNRDLGDALGQNREKEEEELMKQTLKNITEEAKQLEYKYIQMKTDVDVLKLAHVAKNNHVSGGSTTGDSTGLSQPNPLPPDLEELNAVVLYHTRQLANHKAWISRNARAIDGVTARIEKNRAHAWSDPTLALVRKQLQGLEIKADLQRSLSSKQGEEHLRRAMLGLLNKMQTEIPPSPAVGSKNGSRANSTLPNIKSPRGEVAASPRPSPSSRIHQKQQSPSPRLVRASSKTSS